MHVFLSPDDGSARSVFLPSLPLRDVETETQEGKVTFQGHMVNK